MLMLLQMTSILLMMMSAMLAMAFFTLSERKFLGYMQSRKGPNKPSMMAIATPIGDAGKLFSKEKKPSLMSNSKYYYMAPMTMMTLALLMWPIFPHSYSLFFMKFNIAYFLCISSMSVYTTFMAGWSSNSKWSMLGALRGIAQTVSYEVSMALIIITLISHQCTMNLAHMKNQNIWISIITLPLVMAWLTSIMAETHRAPLDFTEGESELVSGFNIEYMSSTFALIFMAEYMNILFMSMLSSSLFLKTYFNLEMILLTTLISTIFIWTRGALPRLRYDILMKLAWKNFLPITLFLTMFMIPVMMTWYSAGWTDNIDDIK